MRNKIRIGILISGGGSNLQAIIDSCNNGEINAELAFVGSDNPRADGLKRAANYKIPSFVVDYASIIGKFKADPSQARLPGDFNFDDILAKQTLVRGQDDSDKVKFFLLGPRPS